MVSQLGDDKDNGIIYQVRDLHIKGITCYLTFSWGSYGGGTQYERIRIFRQKGSRMMLCTGFSDKGKLSITYPRSGQIDITYNTTTQTLSWDEFLYEDTDNTYRRTGKRMLLDL